MAPAGPDGAKIAELLRTSLRVGTATLGELTGAAVKRLLEKGNAGKAKRLFDDAERKQLARLIGATNAAGELLGRSRVRLRMEKVQKHDEQFSVFDDASPIHPMAPIEALSYFKRLVPTLNLDPQDFATDIGQSAFTIAGITEESLLERIQEIIANALATGGDKAVVPSVDEILNEAGLSPRNPQRAEMIVRTNMMKAVSEGVTREMQDPDVADYFPAWMYSGVRDGRQGKDHEQHFDKYFPNSVTFDEVRGPRVFNCRCVQIPIDKHTWADLQARGTRFASFAEAPVPAVEQNRPWTCGPAALVAVLSRYDRTVDEADVSRTLGTTEEAGTSPEQMEAGARSLGLDVEALHGMTTPQLERAIIMGQPVIACVQMHGDAAAMADEEAGHWIIFTGRHRGTLDCMDPATGETAEIAKADLPRVWRDRDAEGMPFRRYGLVVRGTS